MQLSLIRAMQPRSRSMQTVMTPPMLTTPAQTSNAGGTGLPPVYMNMNQHPVFLPQVFNPQPFANPAMWSAFPTPWPVAFQAMQCQAPMAQAICTPSASTQINPETRSPSHSSMDSPDVVDPFLSREEQDEFRETEEEEASDEEEETSSSTQKKFLPGKHTIHASTGKCILKTTQKCTTQATSGSISPPSRV